jgi:hypothetical protein
MTSPTRLLDSAQNPNARALLRAGLEDGPKPAALRATALALGVTASVALTAPATAMVAPSLALVTAKWVAVGTLAGVTLASGVNAITTRVDAPSRAPLAAPLRPSTVPSRATAAPPVAPELAALPEPPADVTPPVVARLPVPVPAPPLSSPLAEVSTVAPPAAVLAERPDLASEVANIDAARRALAAGDAAIALQQLERYYSRARTGTLDREAQLLRIDALLRAGQADRAYQLAEQYLARYPQDPHAARLRGLVGDRSGAPQTRPEWR